MTLQNALNQLIASEEFKAAARTDAKLRVYKRRILAGALAYDTAIPLLLRFGYSLKIVKNVKRKRDTKDHC